MRRSAFSILEVMVVAIVLAILSTVAISYYQQAYQNTVFGQGEDIVELITSAQRSYRFEAGSYTTCANADDCSTKLHLDVPVGDWSYAVTTSGTSVVITATYTGARSDVNSCSRTLNADGTRTSVSCN